MYELKVVTQFSAAHSLRNFHGKCEDLHGHNWKVEIYVVSEELDQAEIVMDFGELKDMAEEVLSGLDHKHLNELEFFQAYNPSSENIARFIYEGLVSIIDRPAVSVSRVSAWESDTSCATYIP
ncbi:MAG: 6-carboxytetrahydropterin synthase QueD [Candidatus Adiutricales bacterium]